MPYTDDQLSRIFDRADGQCHICAKNLCYSNYAQFGRRGAWEVEHSKPRCNGGSDHGNNLYPAHIICNREKGSLTTRIARGWNGRTKAPLSRERKEEIRNRNRLGCGAIGALTGGVMGGPARFVLGAVFGGAFGDQIKPA
jgi:5-methylcytosine-specific restriction endonuclease McrA